MFLIREIVRLVADVLLFGWATRRLAIPLIVALVALAVLLSAAVTTVGPVAVYPFL